MGPTATTALFSSLTAFLWIISGCSANGDEFLVYWNIPSFQCKPFRLPQLNVTTEFGIVQNPDDQFRGPRITILYDPGLFPALFANRTAGGAHVRRNGGVPQAGALRAHLAHFERDLDAQMPDRQHAGLAVIDFESWRPVFRQNFGSLEPYRRLSAQLVRAARNNHSDTDGGELSADKAIESEARRRFEEGARDFLLETLQLARRLRPRAQWGFYGLPFCFNERRPACAEYVRDENDGYRWLFDAAQLVLASVYWTEKFAADNRVGMVRGRVAEARRVARSGQRVLVYHRYVYADSRRYLDMTETQAIFQAIKAGGADGIVLWGASDDVNNRGKCASFDAYVREILGPAAAAVIEFDLPSNAIDDEANAAAHEAQQRRYSPLAVGLVFVGLLAARHCSTAVVGT